MFSSIRLRQSLRAAVLGALALMVALIVVVPSGANAAKPGNSPNAKLCQKGGWQNLVDGSANRFTSEEACTSYAAQGGTLYTRRSLCDKLLSDAGITVPADARYVLGTPADDNFAGRLHAGTDVLCGFGGDDVVPAFGFSAPDYFLGGEGDDGVGAFYSGLFVGGAGNDWVYDMGAGTFEGGDGDDEVVFACGGTMTSVETVGSCYE